MLGYEFNNPKLLVSALTHRSASSRNNERLEFLGDGILNFVVAAELFERRKSVDEGALSRMRASLVRKETLAEIARELRLGDCIALGSGELKSGGFRRDSILADALEAIFGALYLDAGFDTTRDVICRLYAERLVTLPDVSQLKDPKTQLQEWLQARGQSLPDYTLLDAVGKAHEQVFTVCCEVPAYSVSEQAKDTSRRKAEQAAAKAALAVLVQTQAKVSHER